MSDLNKVIAFFVGVFVIILLVGFAISRMQKSDNKAGIGGALGRIFNLSSSVEPTQAPKKETVKEVAVKGKVITPTPQRDRTQLENTAAIPATGSPIIPLAVFSLSSGALIYLKAKQS